MKRLDGRVALITGTGGGQGRAAALLFAAEGARIAGCDLKADGNLETQRLVASAGGTMLAHQPVDVAEPAQVQAWIDDVVAEFGSVDVLYNNAGVAEFGPIDIQPLEAWSSTIRNELHQVFIVTKIAWPHLVASGKGVVLNTGSVAGMVGSQNMPGAAHSAAKAGVIALTRQTAGEGARHNIRANSVSPGLIHTPATDHLLHDPDFPLQEMEAGIPLGRIGVAEDVAKAALFLCSDDSSYITAANLVIDGGSTTILH